ncbi:hypothetical protein N7U66_04060 [Lacinutrix neustonica]|uniref:Uncharacterized protein n=1 Tax=Lacinutrix neustonica TaxID=2980107 RepID=A0A9E8SEZ2_9FLAO|nr:hypothetical protein [Lacinutrix neustonica]WAC02824.1 hypothetical protein N7U66_04060 [Lacinutrix neustonica]
MTIELEFCKIRLFEDYVICNVNEGVTLCPEKSHVITVFLLNHFQKKPFVYITERIHSYSVDPSIYSRSSQVESLKGFAVVAFNYFAASSANYEKNFLQKPFEVFNETSAAEHWAKNLLNAV